MGKKRSFIISRYYYYTLYFLFILDAWNVGNYFLSIHYQITRIFMLAENLLNYKSSLGV